MEIYQGDRHSGKTTKLIELCGQQGALVVFCNEEKMRIKRLIPSIKCFTIEEVIKRRALSGIHCNCYLDNVEMILALILKKPLFFTISGKLIRIGAGNQPKSNFFVSESQEERDKAIAEYALENDFYPICQNHSRSFNLVKNFNTRFPLGYEEFLSGAYYSPGVRGFCLGDAHEFLQRIIGRKIKAVSIGNE